MKGESIISKNSVREFLKQNGKRVASDTFGEVDKEVRELLLKAIKRADKNHRSTVMPQDL
jgi:histone H3/H4